jgi:hypothetical protein
MVCLCDEFSKWHSKECLLGECKSCGIDNFPICPIEEEGLSNLMVNLKHFSLKTIITIKREEENNEHLSTSPQILQAS